MTCGPQSNAMLRPLEPTTFAYIAGIIDGEGCLHALCRLRRKSKNPSGRRVDFEKALVVGMTDGAIIHWLGEVTGVGTVRRLSMDKRRPYGRQAWEWRLQGARQIVALLRAIRPWLRTKATQADLLIELCELQATSHTRARSQEQRQRQLVEMIRAAKRA